MAWPTELLKNIISQHVKHGGDHKSALYKIIDCCGEFLVKFSTIDQSIGFLPVLANVAKWAETNLSRLPDSASMDDISVALLAVVTTNIKYQCDTIRLTQSNASKFAAKHGLSDQVFTTEKLIAAELTYLLTINYQLRVTESDVLRLLQKYGSAPNTLRDIRINVGQSLSLYSTDFKEKLSQLFRAHGIQGLVIHKRARATSSDKFRVRRAISDSEKSSANGALLFHAPKTSGTDLPATKKDNTPEKNEPIKPPVALDKDLLEVAIHTEMRPDQLLFLTQQTDQTWWREMASALIPDNLKFNSFFAQLPSTHLVATLDPMLDYLLKNCKIYQSSIILSLLIDESAESRNARRLAKKAVKMLCLNQILFECCFRLTTEQSIRLLSFIPTNEFISVLESNRKPVECAKLDTQVIFYLLKRYSETEKTNNPSERAEVYRMLVSSPAHLRDLKSHLSSEQYNDLIHQLGPAHIARLIPNDVYMRETLACVKPIRMKVLRHLFRDTFFNMRGLYIFLGLKANDPMDLLRSLSPDEKLILMSSIDCSTPIKALEGINNLFQTEVANCNPYLHGPKRFDAVNRCIQLLEFYTAILYHELNTMMAIDQSEFAARSNLTADDINQAHVNHALERMRTFSRIDLVKFPGCGKGNIGAILKIYDKYLSTREQCKHNAITLYSQPISISQQTNTAHVSTSSLQKKS